MVVDLGFQEAAGNDLISGEKLTSTQRAWCPWRHNVLRIGPVGST